MEILRKIKELVSRPYNQKRYRRLFPSLSRKVINAYLRNPKWAACLPLLSHIKTISERYSPNYIVEFGSGVTTLTITESMSQNAHLVSIDQSDKFLRSTHKSISSKDLRNKRVSLVGPGTDNKIQYNYPFNGLADLVIIDGPTGDRFTDDAFNAYNTLVGKDTICIVDDTDRDYDREKATLLAEMKGLVKRDFKDPNNKNQCYSILFPKNISNDQI